MVVASNNAAMQLPMPKGDVYIITKEDLEPEQQEILEMFLEALMGPTLDGRDKRLNHGKVHWKVDTDHAAAAERHRAARESGETYDPDSGYHHRIHEAWRNLAAAWQEGITQDKGRG